MWKYVARRALASIPVLLLASVLIFLLVREFGADPARQRCQASRDRECITRVREELGLDRSLPVQYVDEMRNFVTGDWGQSQRSDRDVSELISDAMRETVPRAFWAVLVSLVAAVVVGVTSARHPGSVRDYTFTVVGNRGTVTIRAGWTPSVDTPPTTETFEIRLEP